MPTKVPLIIWFHGTDAEGADRILKVGFKAGTYFAAHLEDALAFGGDHIFEVALRQAKRTGPDGWQRVCQEAVPPSVIVRHGVYAPRSWIYENEELRQEIFDEYNGIGGGWH